jgi:hypothetical protein
LVRLSAVFTSEIEADVLDELDGTLITGTEASGLVSEVGFLAEVVFNQGSTIHKFSIALFCNFRAMAIWGLHCDTLCTFLINYLTLATFTINKQKIVLILSLVMLLKGEPMVDVWWHRMYQ